MSGSAEAEHHHEEGDLHVRYDQGVEGAEDPRASPRVPSPGVVRYKSPGRGLLDLPRAPGRRAACENQDPPPQDALNSGR
jgi:hypothetical protein